MYSFKEEKKWFHNLLVGRSWASYYLLQASHFLPVKGTQMKSVSWVADRINRGNAGKHLAQCLISEVKQNGKEGKKNGKEGGRR